VFLTYQTAIIKHQNSDTNYYVQPHKLATAGFFATYPREHVSNFEAFFD